MHKYILNPKQIEVFNIVEHFSQKGFYLAGGTALALELGHRESLDFDLFSYKGFKNDDILKDLIDLGYRDIESVIDKLDEYTIFINSVKITFLRYPFKIKGIQKEGNISLTTPIVIGAMKAYALGRRGKWKDYVDMYILLKEYSIKDIIREAKDIYGTIFSERMFLQQLCYFKDVDYTEEVIWRIDNPPSDKEIENFLIDISVK